MNRIVEVHYPGIKRRLVEESLRIFFEIREVPRTEKTIHLGGWSGGVRQLEHIS